ncbi:MAG: hypothetical protein JWM27_570 [Gemmatimonadetes bacterium]|nr:hypothetical protein [Gemmatimonadota bacterium]
MSAAGFPSTRPAARAGRVVLGAAACAAALSGAPTQVRAQGNAQANGPYRITVREAANQPAPGLQSFAFAESGGRWLLIGGRRNGFHRTSDRERTFPSRMSNDSVYVVDPAANRQWRAPLPPALRNRLRTTNMEFFQDGNQLYLVGGYGSTCDEDRPDCYQTFPNLTAVRVASAIAAVISGRADSLARSMASITDERMRVTGGALKKVGRSFYLVFGHNYHTIYQGGVSGVYTHQARRFDIEWAGGLPSIVRYRAAPVPAPTADSSQFRRRDLNVVEAIRPNGRVGLTVYGGVFTPHDGAWLNPVYVDSVNAAPRLTVDRRFTQKMNPYECAQVVMYDRGTRSMLTTLVGGISFYYYDASGTLVPSNINNFMPFVNTVTTLVRRADSTTVEFPQANADSLPARIGANSVFIPRPGIPIVAGTHEVIDFRALPAGRVMLGWMYGGIRATAPQSGELNPTFASSTIYEVWMERTGP